MEEVGRKGARDMPWPLSAECNMITNKQTALLCILQNNIAKSNKVPVKYRTSHRSIHCLTSPYIYSIYNNIPLIPHVPDAIANIINVMSIFDSEFRL
jgi:hypothetical protein